MGAEFTLPVPSATTEAQDNFSNIVSTQILPWLQAISPNLKKVGEEWPSLEGVRAYSLEVKTGRPKQEGYLKVGFDLLTDPVQLTLENEELVKVTTMLSCFDGSNNVSFLFLEDSAVVFKYESGPRISYTKLVTPADLFKNTSTKGELFKAASAADWIYELYQRNIFGELAAKLSN